MLVSACQEVKSPEEAGAKDPELLHDAVHRVTNIMVHDIFSPPVASRVYGYAAIAAYETIALNNPDYNALGNQLNEFTLGPVSEDPNVVLEFASLHAFLNVSEALIFSTDMLETYRDSVYSSLRSAGFSKSEFEASIAYGDLISEHVLNWSKTDNYNETRGTEKFPVTDESGRWIPTPPAYMDAIEPSWNKLRTFVMESADQFKPEPPVEFSMEEGSEFYRQTMEVYEIGNNLTEEEIAIAEFWDCNPFAMQLRGHFMFSIKKLTPGGHWMGIAGIAAKSTNSDYSRTSEAYAVTSVALFDAFISSWDEKYRSNLIRPETVINQHIDAEWKPLLQTPPFPEYTSGHSVISRAAAEVLTNMFGENFYFEDTTEMEYGLPMRPFDSFFEASDEAAVSRLYGGIHYRMAADNGVTQGAGIGKKVVDELSLGSNPIATSE
jgi:hypothetical protein